MRIDSPEASSSEERCLKRIALLGNYIDSGGVGIELGTFRGSFIEHLLSLSPTKLYVVDPWYLAGPDWCGSWIENDTTGLQAFQTILSEYEPEILAGTLAPLPGTSQGILPSLDDGSLDWAYLDSIHTYDQVDFEISQCLKKVKVGGIICGDDYPASQPEHQFFGVVRAVRKHVENGHLELLSDGPLNQFVARVR